TLYVSPSGWSTDCSASNPCDLDYANQTASPGSTIFLMAGTYQRTGGFYPASGSASAGYLTFDGSYNGEAIIRGQITDTPLIHIWQAQYVALQHISVDGMDSSHALGIQYSHHVIIRNVYAHNLGGAGIAASDSDYLILDHNLLFHNGYDPAQGWGSGITLNRTFN